MILNHNNSQLNTALPVPSISKLQLNEFAASGYCMLKNAVENKTVNDLLAATSTLSSAKKGHGVRNLLSESAAIKAFIHSTTIRDIVEPILGEHARPVRAIFFDKTPQANWNVAWHQDTTIAVNGRFDLEGYGPCSEKAGVVHVEPPASILQQLLTLRIHLDVTDENNGALRVIPGTHNQGRILSDEILQIIENLPAIQCPAKPGDILLMRPLLLHSSRKSKKPEHRRIIHVEFSSVELPSPLQWRHL